MTAFKQLFFIIAASVLFLLFYTLQRIGLYFYNIDLASDIPSDAIIASFINGARFDLVIVAYIFLPLILGLFLFWGKSYRRFMMIWLLLFFMVTSFLGIMELEFFHEFHARLNSMVFEYMKEDPKTVTQMIVNGFPVLRYLTAFAVLVLIFYLLLRYISHKTRIEQRNNKDSSVVYIGLVLLLLAGYIVMARGTLRSGPSLRWGDAYTTGHLFTNQLGLNGTFTLFKAATSDKDDNNKHWLTALDNKLALKTTRKMLANANDFLSEKRPVLRQTPANTRYQGQIKNVVVIMMESFAASQIGVLGNRNNITPYFDEISKDGLLFTHFFSNGTHTHQGMFAAVGGFPNLPGYEYLMQEEEGGQQFSGLPVLLKERMKNNVYVYNGDFSWDNQQGFFATQGMTNFVGRFDYENPNFIDPTWGVSDEDMFNRALLELDKLNAKTEPFYAVIQTLSNHVPFNLPDPLPIDKVIDEKGKYSERLTAMRYSDWALGQFYQTLKEKPYFNQSLIVIVGDHGFSTSEQVTDMDLTRFHIPMLLIGPSIQENFGTENSTVGSQVDLTPTVLALLGDSFINQSWGRDLLSLSTDDKGFAVIKPSGSDPSVAIIEGNDILVVQEDVVPTLWQFDMRNKTSQQVINDDKVNDLKTRLFSYIQTAMIALKEGHTGIDGKVKTQ